MFGIGTVEAQVLSKIGFQTAGKVVSVAADQGDQVKAGALLAKLAACRDLARTPGAPVSSDTVNAVLVRLLPDIDPKQFVQAIS